MRGIVYNLKPHPSPPSCCWALGSVNATNLSKFDDMMSLPCMDWLNPTETTLIFLKPTQFTHFQLAIFFWLELNPEGNPSEN